MEDEDLLEGIPPEQQAIQTSSPPGDGLTPVVLLKATPENKKRVQMDPDRFMPYMAPDPQTSSVLVVGTGHSVTQVFKNMTNLLPNGPYKVKGRDNQVLIRNSKTQGKTLFTYTYHGGKGELLEFSIDTNFSTKAKRKAIKTSTVDGKTKAITTTLDGVIQDTNSMYQQGRIKWGGFGNFTGVGTGSIAQSIAYMSEAYTRVKNAKPPEGLLKDDKQFLYKGRPVYNAQSYNEAYKNSTQASIMEQRAAQSLDDITIEMQQEYIKQLKAKFERAKNPKTPEDLELAMKGMSTLDDYVYTKKVKVRKCVRPEDYSSKGKNQQKRNKNAPIGPDFGNPYTPHPVNPMGSGGNAAVAADLQNIQAWQEGFDNVLQNDSWTVAIPNPKDKYGGYKIGNRVFVVQEEEVTIHIPGAKMLAAFPYTTPQSRQNQLVEGASNTIKATARVIGNPLLQDGQNVEVKGVSSRYSGVWHTTKVTHTIDTSGYHCEVEFQQRVTPVVHYAVKQTLSAQRLHADIQAIAKKSVGSGAYLIGEQVLSRVEAVKRTLAPGETYLIQQEKGNPRKFKVLKAGDDYQPSDHLSPKPL